MTTKRAVASIKTRRTIEGMSAVLLPFTPAGKIDFNSFTQNVARTFKAGLQPAVNMDTGYTNLLTPDQRREVLSETKRVAKGKPFVAGAFVEGLPGDFFSNYQSAIAEIRDAGGTPILFQCTAFKKLRPAALVQTYARLGSLCEKVLWFELGEMFVPFGQIYPLEIVRELMQIPQAAGMKHSSLQRGLEWERLELRDRIRPQFKIYTGNDLAIDMVMYGSDYLLGLSAFCPEAFALRDEYWSKSDARFYELNDLLQYLGFFAFRPPVPAYKHTAAQFLKLRKRIKHNQPHPKAARRPESDIAILEDISRRLDALVDV